MPRRNPLPLLRREYLGFTGVRGHLQSFSPCEMPSWCESSWDAEPVMALDSKLSTFKKLLERNDNYATSKDTTGRTPVHLLCTIHSCGQLEVLQILCSANKAAVNVLDGMLRTPLHHALSPDNLNRHVDMSTGPHLVRLIHALINLGAHVNALDYDGISPLHLAMHAGQLIEFPIILEMLINAGADISLLLPVQSRRYGMLEYIRGRDEDDTFDPDCTTVLHLACRMIGPVSITAMTVLLSRGNVNFRDCYGRTPLHDLITSIGQTPLELYSDLENFPEEELFLLKLNFLVSLGADVNAVDRFGATPLCIALQKYKFPLCLLAIRTLLSCGARANCAFLKTRITPMHLLCQYFGRSIPDFLPIFLNAGGEINARDRIGETPLFYALKNVDCDIHLVEYLISNGADLMATDVGGKNCLHVFWGQQQSKSEEMAEYLVKKGCSINGKDAKGDTPLIVHLMSAGEPKLQETLIRLGADVRAKNNVGLSSLHVICQSRCRKRSQIVDILIKSGANVNAKDDSNLNPLLYEMRGPANEEIVRLLLVAGADPNHQVDEGPLHIAAFSGNLPLTNLLLAFGADVNLVDVKGRTPLHRAIQNTKGDANKCLMTLIEAGADPTVTQILTARTPLMMVTYKTKNYFLPYIAVLISTKRYSLSIEERRFFCFNEILKSILTDCIKIARLLNEVFIGNAGTTAAEFLLMPAERARRMLRNPETRDRVTSVVPSHHYFCSLINQRFALMDHLNDLERENIPLLNLIHSESLPLLVREHIWSYLTYPDKVSLSKIMVP